MLGGVEYKYEAVGRVGMEGRIGLEYDESLDDIGRLGCMGTVQKDIDYQSMMGRLKGKEFGNTCLFKAVGVLVDGIDGLG